jgi:hypothetical protein
VTTVAPIERAESAKIPVGLQPTEGVTRFHEHGSRWHEDPSGSRKRGLDALHETAIP